MPALPAVCHEVEEAEQGEASPGNQGKWEQKDRYHVQCLTYHVSFIYRPIVNEIRQPHHPDREPYNATEYKKRMICEDGVFVQTKGHSKTCDSEEQLGNGKSTRVLVSWIHHFALEYSCVIVF